MPCPGVRTAGAAGAALGTPGSTRCRHAGLGPALPHRLRRKPLERLTCLVVPRDGEPRLVVPLLERPAAEARRAPAPGWRSSPGGRPTTRMRSRRPAAVGAPDGRGRRPHVGRAVLAAARPPCRTPSRLAAGRSCRELRMRKAADEVAALRQAGAAIDRVHARMGGVPAGRAHRTRGRPPTIAAAIVAEGHVDGRLRHRRRPGPTAPPPTTRCPTGSSRPATRSSSTSAARPRPATAPTAPGRTPSGCAARGSWRTTRVLQARSSRGATPPGRASLPSRSTGRPGGDHATPATASASSTAPATASGWRRTRSPTSSRATNWCSSPAWRSRSSRASTCPAGTAPGSRTSWSPPTTASSGSTRPPTSSPCWRGRVHVT